MAAEVGGQVVRVAPNGSLAGVLGAGLRGGRGIALIRGGERGSLERFQLVAQAMPAGQRIAIGLAVALRNGAESIGSKAQRRLRFGVQLVEARVAILR